VRHALLVALFAASCATTVTEQLDTCLVSLDPVEAPATAGDPLTVTGSPFTASWDTRVLIGGLTADVVEVTRLDCSSCDACVADEDCSACGSCEACEVLCAPCVQSVVLTVPPELSTGNHAFILYNRYGSSRDVTLDVLAAVDSDTPDTEPTDSEPADSDSDLPDTDPVDSDPPDTDPADSDTDAPDSEPIDSDTDAPDSDSDQDTP
jgi:hypothetical protein